MVQPRFESEPEQPSSQPSASWSDQVTTSTPTPTSAPTSTPEAETPREAQRRERGQKRRRVARKTVAVLPTLLTLGNLLSGFAAIFAASRLLEDPSALPFDWTPLTFAAIFIFLGMAFDSLDGGVARLTRSATELGEQLDSMADMVTFGVAPAFLAVQLVGVGVPFISELENDDALFDRIAIVVAAIYVVCSALRLARFNIELEGDDEASHASFKGLPSPGAAGTVASLILLHQHFLARYPADHWSVEVAAVVMVGVMLLAALAMVSAFRYVHVVNRFLRGRAPIGSLAHAVIVALLLVVYPQAALAGIFVLYALSAPVSAARRWVVRKVGKGEAPAAADDEPAGATQPSHGD